MTITELARLSGLTEEQVIKHLGTMQSQVANGSFPERKAKREDTSYLLQIVESCSLCSGSTSLFFHMRDIMKKEPAYHALRLAHRRKHMHLPVESEIRKVQTCSKCATRLEEKSKDELIVLLLKTVNGGRTGTVTRKGPWNIGF